MVHRRLALFSLWLVLGMSVAQRSEAQSMAGRVVPPLMLATGAGLVLSALSPEATLLVRAGDEDVGPSYRRMQRAVGPLSGIGLAFPLSLWAGGGMLLKAYARAYSHFT